MRTVLGFVGVAAALAASLSPAATGPAAARTPSAASRFSAVVREIEAQPYQSAYVPAGLDSAFAPTPVLNDFPVEDYTDGSIPGSPRTPAWPVALAPVAFTSADGAPLLGHMGIHPGHHPGVVVAHGFNTNGSVSVVRWAAMLYASGYDVIAADQRDFAAEYQSGQGYPTWLQSFGDKEANDVLAAGRLLRAQPGVGGVGLVGFSEGAQNAVLAASRDTSHVFSAVITFSGPADQNQQIASTAVPPGCTPPACSYPATDALVALVVPPYTYHDPCAVLQDAATRYATTQRAVLAGESAMHAQTAVSVPLLTFYAADDPLVAQSNAALMAAYQAHTDLQRTVLIQHGNHAYYYDRWWQQRAILLYFRALLPTEAAAPTTTPTVNQTPGGPPLSTQLAPVPHFSRSAADASLAPDICDGGPPPGRPKSR